MKKLLTILFLLLSTQVSAQDYNKGLKAYIAEDYPTAYEEWKSLAELGNVRAQNSLGGMYEYGNGVLKDYSEAVKWYQLSAEQGNARAQNNLGYMYQLGNGVLKDYSEAEKWYRLAAEQSYANAQFNLGMIYLTGYGIPQDNVTAHMWHNIASANRNKTAGEFRDELEAKMTAEDISKATAMASLKLQLWLENVWLVVTRSVGIKLIYYFPPIDT